MRKVCTPEAGAVCDAIEAAIAEWDGKSWVSGADELLARVSAKRRPFADVDPAWYGDEADANAWRETLRDIDADADPLGSALAIQERENKAVERAARTARQYAREAIAWLRDPDGCDIGNAATCLEAAADEERNYGDAPAYGEIAEFLRMLADNATTDAQADDLTEDLLNDAYGALAVAGCEFPAGRVLRTMDPITFQQMRAAEWLEFAPGVYLPSGIV